MRKGLLAFYIMFYDWHRNSLSQACIKLFIRFLISVNAAHALPVNFNKIRLFIKSS